MNGAFVITARGEAALTVHGQSRIRMRFDGSCPGPPADGMFPALPNWSPAFAEPHYVDVAAS
jgi:hypothetical protein